VGAALTLNYRETSSEPGESEEIERTIEALRSAVRHQAGYLTEADIPTGPQITAVRDAADLSSVSAHLPLQSTLPYIGPLLVAVQRAIRLCLRWYINPIVEQQNAFNESVVRALTELELRQTALERKIERTSSPEGSDGQ
jgi:hypothetical protein